MRNKKPPSHKKLSLCIIFSVILQIAISAEDAVARDILYPKDNPIFDVPEGLKPNVAFWKDIYSKYDTDTIIIHDNVYLDIVYEAADISENLNILNPSDYMVNKEGGKIKAYYQKLVKDIAKTDEKDIDKLTDKEKTIYNTLSSHYQKSEIKDAYNNIRMQLGQKDRFIQGIKRSGLYIDKIKDIFQSFDLPVELTVIPHVESSFNFNAYSKLGAAGIWQFTRPTGKRFLKIGYEVDDRLDPITATTAAAQLLKENYETLGSWPLAITAYNHGLEGMKRAKNAVGDDMSAIVDRYKSRLFKFASRNFYSEFLAALEIMRDYKAYFGDIEIEEPLQYDTVKLDKYIGVSTVSKYFNMTKEELHLYNPSIRPPVLAAKRHIPKGFNLKVPSNFSDVADKDKLYAMIPSENRFERQEESKYHTVRKGDTIGTIAELYNTSVKELKRLNNIGNSHLIFKGEVIQIPSASASNVQKPLEKIEVAKLDKDIPQKELIATDKKKITDNSLLVNAVPVVPDRRLTSDYLRKKAEDGYLNKNGNIRVIEIETDETLAHYSEWANVPSQKIKTLNKISLRQNIKIGGKLHIPFDKITPEEFQRKREEYHKGIEEDFFSNYSIEKISSYTLKKGDTLWKIVEENEIPYWLLQGYNSDKDLSKLAIGDSLFVPLIAENKQQ